MLSMDGLLPALRRVMAGLEGQATFESVESTFSFARCIRQGSVEAPRLWLKMAMQILGNVEPEWVETMMGVLTEEREGRDHQICSFMWADNYWIMSPKAHLERMVKDFIEEAERWELEPKPASLWRKNTCAYEMMEDITISTRAGRQKILFEKSFTILGYTINQAGRTQDCLEERTHNANKGFVEGCAVSQKQRRAVESEVSENDGACLQSKMLWKRKMSCGMKQSLTEVQNVVQIQKERG